MGERSAPHDGNKVNSHGSAKDRGLDPNTDSQEKDLKSHSTTGGSDGMPQLESCPEMISKPHSPPVKWSVHTPMQHKVEPYEGLVIQKAPILREHNQTKVSKEEPESESSSTTSEQQRSKKRGYWSRGRTFIPFSKLFTKPHSASSRQSSKSPSLIEGVENSYQRLSESEQDIIRKTRTALKQRFDSAEKRRNSKNSNKIQLSIFVTSHPDSDDDRDDYNDGEQGTGRGGVSDVTKTTRHYPQHSVNQTSSPTHSTDDKIQSKTKRQINRGQEPTGTPSFMLKPPAVTISKKKSQIKNENKESTMRTTTTKPARKTKKPDIPTIMSETSPVPSDLEYESTTETHHYNANHSSQTNIYNYNTQEKADKKRGSLRGGGGAGGDDEGGGCGVAGRGGLLQTIISDAETLPPQAAKTTKGKK